MKRFEKLLNYTITLLGLISSVSFVAGYYIFEILRPKMIRFEEITTAEEGLMNYFGIGLLLFLAFALLSFFKIAKILKNAKKISLVHLILLAVCVLSFLFIFGDIALLNDIGKQYKHGLSQPEWSILYIVMAFQLISTLILTYANLFKLKTEKGVKNILRDSNIFLTAQYVGVICGLMGIAFTSINFGFPRNLEMMKLHLTMTSIVLLIPYFLIVGYWFFVKLGEKTKEWYDEKQMQDLGKSALLSLVLSVAIMGLLFILNFNSLDKLLSVLWFPNYVFLVIFLFSAGNLYFSQKNQG